MTTHDLVHDPVSKIRKLLDEVRASVKMSLEAAVELGGALTEQKAAMKHGEFGPWLKENFPDITWQTANKYMKVYANRDEVQAKLKSGSNLTEAYKLLPAKKRTPKPKPPDPKLKSGFNLPEPEEPVVLDVEGVEVPEPEPPDPKLEKISNLTDVYKLGSKPEPPTPEPIEPDRGPPIITTDEIFREASPEVEDDFPVYEGATAAEVLAKSGLPKPMNWGAAPIAQMTRKEAEARRPGYKWPEGSRDTHEDFEAFVEQDSGPSDPERDALPDEWIGPLYRLLEAGHGDAVETVLGRLLKKFDLGD